MPRGRATRADSYERLEFLGDSVLELAMARELYERYPDFSEGRLAKIRSHVVSRASCAVVSRQLELGKELAERGADIPADELERLSRNRNVLAALLEAALAALFLEHGFEKIEQPIVQAFAGRIDYALNSHVDYKTELQEVLARQGQVGELLRARGRGAAARPALHDLRVHRRGAVRRRQRRVEEGSRAGGRQGGPGKARGRGLDGVESARTEGRIHGQGS